MPASEGEIELEPGEEIVMHVHAAFRGGAAASARGTFSLGSARYRNAQHAAWLEHATAAGFPAAPADMIVAVTDRRLLIGRPNFWGGKPAHYVDDFPLPRIAKAITVRHGLVTSAAFALTNGHIVEIESMRGGRLRRFIDTINSRLVR